VERRAKVGAPRSDTAWAHASPMVHLLRSKEDTTVVTKLLLVCLVAKRGKVIVGLLVGEEEKQTQELAMDTSRCRHARL
jgi:hypothetical protein